MPIVENLNGKPIPLGLLEKLRRVSYPALGHFHERGFVDSEIRSQALGLKDSHVK
jgi:hypothetical protein